MSKDMHRNKNLFRVFAKVKKSNNKLEEDRRNGWLKSCTCTALKLYYTKNNGKITNYVPFHDDFLALTCQQASSWVCMSKDSVNIAASMAAL